MCLTSLLEKKGGQESTVLLFSSSQGSRSMLYLNSIVNHCIRITILSGEIVSA